MRRARAMSRRGVWFFISLAVGLAALGQWVHCRRFVMPLSHGLHSVKSIPRIDAGVVAVGEGELHCVASDELHVRDADVVRHRLDVKGANSRPLVDATGAGAFTPKLSYVMTMQRFVAPGYLQYSFRLLQRDVGWCIAHDRLAPSGFVHAVLFQISAYVQVMCLQVAESLVDRRWSSGLSGSGTVEC